MENCDDEAFLDSEDELWAKIYPDQADAIEAQEGGNDGDILVAADSNDRDKGEELSAFFDDCDGDVTKIALPEVQKGKLCKELNMGSCVIANLFLRLYLAFVLRCNSIKGISDFNK